jgi:hypothetical protein
MTTGMAVGPALVRAIVVDDVDESMRVPAVDGPYTSR